MTGLHESTLGLSVYNAIRECGALTIDQIYVRLNSFWTSAFTRSEAERGVAYLLARNFVREEDGVISAAHILNGLPHPLRRSAEVTELALL
jgi:hypothetical protein